MKKKVIISNYDDINNPYYAGGGAHAVHRVARLLQKDFSITVITGKYPGSTNQIIDQVTYKRIGTHLLGPKIGQLMYQFLLPYYTLKEQYDVWVESFTPPFSTACLQLFTKKPVIGLVHMLSGEDMERKYKLPFTLIEKFGLRFYKHFITTTDYVAKTIGKTNKTASIDVIPNGVDIPSLSNKTKKKHLLFIGRIEVNQKGLDLLISAYKTISKLADYPLVIAGSGENKQINLLQELVKKSGQQNNIKLIGKVSGEQKDKLIKNSFCIIIPSRFETFSISALEALTYGIPLIIFPIHGLDWVPSNACIRAKSLNAKALTLAMKQCLTDKKLQTSLKKNGIAFSKKYSWEAIANKYKRTILASYEK